jgi:hypothetical protein
LDIRPFCSLFPAWHDGLFIILRPPKTLFIDYSVGEVIYRALDEEALRVVKLFQPEFLPAGKDGKKVQSKVRIPIVFILHN